MGLLSHQFSFLGGVPSHVALRPPAPSTRAASWAIPRRTRTAPYSTTPTSSWPAWSVTVRPRPGRWPPAGTPAVPGPGPDGAADSAPERLKIANPTVLARIPEPSSPTCCTGIYTTRCSCPFRSGRGAPNWLALPDDAIAAIRAAGRGPVGRPSGWLSGLRRLSRPRATLADDRLPHPEGLDRPEGGGRLAGGRHLAGPSGAAGRGADQPRAPAPATGLDAVLPAGRAVRRRRAAPPGHPRLRPARRAPDGQQSARQRRPAPA